MFKIPKTERVVLGTEERDSDHGALGRDHKSFLAKVPESRDSSQGKVRGNSHDLKGRKKKERNCLGLAFSAG